MTVPATIPALDARIAALAARDFGTPALVQRSLVPGEAMGRAPQRAVRAQPLGLVSGGN